MRYPATEKLEIIKLVEQSYLSARQILDRLSVPKTNFYRWYVKYFEGDLEGLKDKPSRPNCV